MAVHTTVSLVSLHLAAAAALGDTPPSQPSNQGFTDGYD
jgi:hypothetical protein